MSWKQQALKQLDNWLIAFEDQSNGRTYIGVLTAPDTCFLYETGTKTHTVIVERYKGSDKSIFWYRVEQAASVGTFLEEFYDDWLKQTTEFDNQQEKE